LAFDHLQEDYHYAQTCPCFAMKGIFVAIPQKNIQFFFFFFSYIFLGVLCVLCTSAAPQRPAHGTVPSQVATHLRTDRVCRVLGRSWIRTQDYCFAVRCATTEPPLLLKIFKHFAKFEWQYSPFRAIFTFSSS
jgi:hypothetical protein